MGRPGLAGWSAARLRLVLGIFFLALAIPTGLLIHQAFGHLKWAAFRQHQLLAEELAARVDNRLRALVAAEAARPAADYAFLAGAADAPGALPQRSPLAQFPVPPSFPGLIGHFQVDASGALSTPLVPPPGRDAAELGIGAGELAGRAELEGRIRRILTENRLVQAPRAEAPAAPPTPRDEESGGMPALASVPEHPAAAAKAKLKAEPQAAFDRLSEQEESAPRERRSQARGALGRLEDLRLDERFQQAQAPPPASAAGGAAGPRGAATEGSATAAGSARGAPAEPRAAERDAAPGIRLFDDEGGPLQLRLLDSGDFVLFRQVWQGGQRLIQGALIGQQALLAGGVEAPFRETVLSRTTDLVAAWQGDVLSAYASRGARVYLSSADELRGALLLRTRLSSPLEGMELVFSVAELPAGPGARLLSWLAAALAAVLCGGVLLMYWLGLRQIALARQQQDFVSAVSHELKTPLTSIRLYAELLREGWAAEEKRRAYYAYIHDESERLSRLIENVLRLARLSRNDLRLNPRPVAVGELLDLLRAKVASQVERAGFSLQVACAPEVAAALISVDTDAVSQILINLVDNALKFAARAERRAVDIGCRAGERGTLVFSVRDYGPGIPRDQVRKIFRLFYRADGGLTRETPGTGIGLALVRQLTQAMGGTVDVIDREPGAEFRVRFPRMG